MTSTTDRSVVHDSFTIERTYPAAPERVFAAWTSLAAKQQWFGGDGESDAVTEHTLDFRVGGREHLAGRAGGDAYTYDALYQDVVDGERIVWSYEMSINGHRISVSVGTLEVSGAPGGARLVLTEQGAFLDGLDTNEARRGGTEALLDELGRVFAD